MTSGDRCGRDWGAPGVACLGRDAAGSRRKPYRRVSAGAGGPTPEGWPGALPRTTSPSGRVPHACPRPSRTGAAGTCGVKPLGPRKMPCGMSSLCVQEVEGWPPGRVITDRLSTGSSEIKPGGTRPNPPGSARWPTADGAMPALSTSESRAGAVKTRRQPCSGRFVSAS